MRRVHRIEGGAVLVGELLDACGSSACSASSAISDAPMTATDFGCRNTSRSTSRERQRAASDIDGGQVDGHRFSGFGARVEEDDTAVRLRPFALRGKASEPIDGRAQRGTVPRCPLDRCDRSWWSARRWRGCGRPRSCAGSGFDGPLSLVGAEPHLPYDRPPALQGVPGGRDRAPRHRSAPPALRRPRPRLAARAAGDRRSTSGAADGRGLDDG